MQAPGVEGARIVLGGRLGGAEIARSEELKEVLSHFKLSVLILITREKEQPSLTELSVLKFGFIEVKFCKE